MECTNGCLPAHPFLPSRVDMQNFRLVTFDITNTLLHFRVPVGQVYSQAGKIFGIQSSASALNTSFKKHFKELSKEKPNFGAQSGLSSENWWTQVVERTFRDGGCTDITDQQLRLVAQHLLKSYATDDYWEVSPGSHTLLQKLRDAQIHVGAISNSDERLESILKVTDLRQYFDFVLASYVVGHQKPSAEIFNIALRRADCSAKDAVHVGDNLELDYFAARNAGWNAFLLTQDDTRVPVDNRVRDIFELQKRILN